MLFVAYILAPLIRLLTLHVAAVDRARRVAMKGAFRRLHDRRHVVAFGVVRAALQAVSLAATLPAAALHELLAAWGLSIMGRDVEWGRAAQHLRDIVTYHAVGPRVREAIAELTGRDSGTGDAG